MTENTNTRIGPSFSLRNRLLRVLWGLVWSTCFRFSPRPCHAWRSFLLRCFGAKVGKHVHVYPGVVIWAPWHLEIGNETGVGDRTILYSQGKITLGNRVVISQGSHLCAGTHDFEAPGFPLVTKPITIQDDVWIAAEVFIHPGVLIKEGCVIGARSVVVTDLPEWMVCSGFPAKPLKPRKRCST